MSLRGADAQSVFSNIFKFVHLMPMSNIRFIFSFCLGLGSVLTVSGSQVMESTQSLPVLMADNHQSSPEGDDGVPDAPSFSQEYLDPAKKFLKDEARTLQGWMLENLSTGHSRETPRVIIDLPPATPRAPKTNGPQSEQLIKPIVPTEKPAPAPELAPTPDPAPEPAPTPVSVVPTPAVEIRTFFPGNPKPEVTLKQEEPAKVEKPAPMPVQDEKETEKKTEKKVEEKPEEQVQDKVTIAPAPPGVGLMLGLSLKLGMTHQGNESSCIIKQNGYVHFCAQSVNWPDHIKVLFKTNGILYKGTQAIGRYDGKKLTHTHALFFETGFKDVISYLEERYGPPIEVFYRIVTPFEGIPRDNPTFIWRKNETVLDKSINVTLEVRKFDDAGGRFPDMKHGFIRLYGDGSLSIFPQVSPRELMLVKYKAN